MAMAAIIQIACTNRHALIGIGVGATDEDALPARVEDVCERIGGGALRNLLARIIVVRARVACNTSSAQRY
jgi:hypothetical protein